MEAPLLGGVLAILTSFLSACGGIYNEQLLKARPSACIHWQNVQMYVWGILFNAVGAWIEDGSRIARNGLIDHLRAHRQTLGVTALESLVEYGPDPLQRVLEGERMRHLGELLLGAREPIGEERERLRAATAPVSRKKVQSVPS